MSTIVVAGAPADPAHYRDVITTADRVVAVDAGADLCLAVGRTPDIAIGDFDSASALTIERLTRSHVQMLRHESDKDVSDLELALDEVAERRWGPVVLSCVFGHRFDHTLGALGAVVRRPTLVREVWEPDTRAWPLDARTRPRLELRGRGATVSIFAVSGSAIVTCTGMRYPLPPELPELVSRGLSNVLESDLALVEVTAGRVLVVSTHVDGFDPACATG